MAANIKFSDIIKTYQDYQTSGEFSTWIDKLQLVAQLQGVEDLAKFVPLFLSGSAFALYQQLSDDTKKDFTKIKTELATAFSTDPFASYELLRNRVLLEGESVDVYLADLRRLVSLTGQQTAGPILRCAFVAGLPSDISLQLRSTANIASLELSEILSKARAMMASKSSSSMYACAATVKYDNRNKTCFNCGGSGHIAKNCPSPKQISNNFTQKVRKCYNCGSHEHLANKCTQESGNASGGVSASDARPKLNQ